VKKITKKHQSASINNLISFHAVNFDHFQILRAIGKGSFGKVSNLFLRVPESVACARMAYDRMAASEWPSE
jgi:hypothetical protein